mgnify:CR=1 FL=1
MRGMRYVVVFYLHVTHMSYCICTDKYRYIHKGIAQAYTYGYTTIRTRFQRVTTMRKIPGFHIESW